MRNIAVFTCNRADEGPMGPVINALRDRQELSVWPATCHSGKPVFSWGVDADWKPDWLLVLGDRHELLPACHYALLHQIPIAHIHGGETTLGSFDDRVRNAVSQLASLHFTAAEMFSDKLRAMRVPGEIFTVGPPGLDDLETDDTSEFGSGFFLVCLHPDTTLDHNRNSYMTAALQEALWRFKERQIVIIGPNNDPHGPQIAALLKNFTVGHPSAVYVDSLPRRRYLTALKHASVCIGNSSSFVIEAPALGTPTVLVGDRQKGRPLATSIRECPPEAPAIAHAIDVATKIGFDADEFTDTPYGHGGASQKIAKAMAEWQS